LLFATVFAVTFVAEVPGKSLFASLVLGTRYRPGHVWAGAAAAFAVHCVLAVTASFAARSHDPLVVGPAALLALWAVSAVAVFGGSKLLERVPVRRVRLGAAGALAAPGLCSLLQALTKLA
jgi:Ca2+/H+ antiporter, TMEM165/GDT1 family